MQKTNETYCDFYRPSTATAISIVISEKQLINCSLKSLNLLVDSKLKRKKFDKSTPNIKSERTKKLMARERAIESSNRKKEKHRTMDLQMRERQIRSQIFSRKRKTLLKRNYKKIKTKSSMRTIKHCALSVKDPNAPFHAKVYVVALSIANVSLSATKNTMRNHNPISLKKSAWIYRNGDRRDSSRRHVPTAVRRTIISSVPSVSKQELTSLKTQSITKKKKQPKSKRRRAKVMKMHCIDVLQLESAISSFIWPVCFLPSSKESFQIIQARLLKMYQTYPSYFVVLHTTATYATVSILNQQNYVASVVFVAA